MPEKDENGVHLSDEEHRVLRDYFLAGFTRMPDGDRKILQDTLDWFDKMKLEPNMFFTDLTGIDPEADLEGDN